MATAHTTTDRTADNRLPALRFPAGWLDTKHLALAAATAVEYVMLTVGLTIGAMITAVYLASLLPGLAGVVAFVTIGLPMICGAPMAARRIVTGTEVSRHLDSRHRRHPQPTVSLPWR